MKYLRQYIRQLLKEELQKEGFFGKKKPLKSIKDVETIGDFRRIIKMAQNKKRSESAKEMGIGAVKSAVVDEIVGKVPGLSAAKSMYDSFKAIYELPDESRTGTSLDYLDVDDDIATIVDDPIENAFLKDLTTSLEKEDGSKLLKDINITKMLAKYIEKEFNNRTLTGFEDSE